MQSLACNCRICRNNLAEFTNSLASSGFSFSAIKRKLKQEKSFEVSENVIKRHIEAFDIEATQEILEMQATRQDIPKYDLNEIPIILQQYDFNPKDPLSIVQYIQKAHLGIYLKQLEVVNQYINEYACGYRDVYPSIEVTNLKKLFDLLDSITGISIFANQQAAMSKVESMGLNISQQYQPLIPTEEFSA